MKIRRVLQVFAVLAGSVCALMGGAKAQSEIIVYTGYELEDLGPYKAAFERDNPGLQIRWVHDANGVITARLLAEKANARADAAWGVAASSMGLLAERGVLQPYTSSNLASIPKKFRDHREPPAWFGNSAWVSALIFNTAEGERLRIPKPETWKDLLKEVYRGKIVMPHPASSGTGFLYVSAWLHTAKEIVDHGFDGAESAVLAGLIAALTLALTLFRRDDLSWQPPEPVAAVLRFCGRYSLEIYAATLLAMQVTAYAIEDSNAEDETEG